MMALKFGACCVQMTCHVSVITTDAIRQEHFLSCKALWKNGPVPPADLLKWCWISVSILSLSLIPQWCFYVNNNQDAFNQENVALSSFFRFAHY